MAITSKEFSDGQLATTIGTVYTVLGGEAMVGATMNLYNLNAATQTVEVFYNTSGTDRKFHQVTLAQNESSDVEIPTLTAASLIRANTTTASAVNYLITGGSET